MGSTPLVVRKNNCLRNGARVLPVWGPEYEVRFDLKVNSWPSNYGQIFRFSSLTGDCCSIGQRIPAMWTQIGSKDLLLLTTNIDSNGNKAFVDELGRFQPGVWCSFVISQKKDSVRFPLKRFLQFNS